MATKKKVTKKTTKLTEKQAAAIVDKGMATVGELVDNPPVITEDEVNQGMEPFQAIQSIAVIEGKPCLYGDGLIGVVRASPKCKWIEETLSEDGKTATCRTQRDGDPNPVTASYSMDDAIQAGIATKFNWKKHPKRMLQMRARAY